MTAVGQLPDWPLRNDFARCAFRESGPRAFFRADVDPCGRLVAINNRTFGCYFAIFAYCPAPVEL